MTMDFAPFLKTIVASVLYSVIGIVMFAAGFLVIKLVTGLSMASIRKEIEVDQNTALAIVIGSVILGLSLIIAHAIGG
jgi:putative membrane protein